MREQGFDPVTTYYFLRDNGGAFAIEDVDRFWQTLMAGGDHEAAKRVAAEGGWLASAYELRQDTHWEMHPQGNELLLMLSGSLTAVFEEPSGTRSVEVSAGRACLVRQGVWHRLLVNEPGVLFAVTFGRGTQHRPADDKAMPPERAGERNG